MRLTTCLSASLLALAVLVPAAPLGAAQWIPINRPTAHAGRMGAQVVYDASRSRFVLFGGYSRNAYHSDVFVLPIGADDWMPLIVGGTPPPGRYLSSAVFDPSGDRLVVYGGFNGSTVFADAWQLSFAGTPTWSPLTPGGSPPGARGGAMAAYDPLRHQMVLFGGFTNGVVPVNDVWALSLSGGTSWSSIIYATPGAAPTARYGHDFAYDPDHDAFLVFGGFDSHNYLNDTWRLTLAPSPTMTLVPPTGPTPMTRVAAAAAFDPIHHRMVMVGGYSPSAGFLSDLWLFDPTSDTWSPSTAPPSHLNGRDYSALVVDPASGRSFLDSGNNNDGQMAELWSMDLDATATSATWKMVRGSIGPHDRATMMTAFDPGRGAPISFGGYGPHGTSNGSHHDLWRWPAPGSNLWDPVTVPSTPADAAGYLAVTDPIGNRMVVLDQQLWQLDLGPASSWSRITYTYPAPLPGGGRMIYDPLRRRIVAFGGEYPTFPRPMSSEVWTFDLADGGGWTQVFPAGSLPAPRVDPAMVYDSDDDGAIVFGGERPSSGMYNDTWLLRFSPTLEWVQLHDGLGVAPGPHARCPSWYDPVRHRLILFGGQNPSTGFDQQTWMLSPSDRTWVQPTLVGEIPARRFSAMTAYDPGTDRFLMAGGISDSDGYSAETSDLWALTFNDGPTATLADVIDAHLDGNRAILAWQLGGGGSGGAVGLERRIDDGAWAALTALTPDGLGQVHYVDPELSAGSTYAYRLELTQPNGTKIAAGGTSLTLGVRPRLALAGAVPNPATSVRIAFTLPDDQKATLDLFDIDGRRVATRAVGTLGPGAHVMELGQAGRYAPGLYFARLRHGDQTRIARLTVVR